MTSIPVVHSVPVFASDAKAPLNDRAAQGNYFRNVDVLAASATKMGSFVYNTRLGSGPSLIDYK